ncbi:MAG: hypothetical protein AAF730_17460, partial [Bacteroidota bacterium]
SEVRLFLTQIIQRWLLSHEEFVLPIGPLDSVVGRSYQASEMGIYLYNGMYAFALAHELGHHALQHQGGRRFAKSIGEAGEVIHVDSQSHIEELEADFYGLQVYLKLKEVSNSKSPLLFRWFFDFAPILLMDIFASLDELRGKINHSTSHPHPHLRIRNMLDHVDLAAPTQLYNDLRTTVRDIILSA